MSWRDLGSRLAAAVTTAAVISMSAFAVVAFGSGGSDNGHGGGLGTFNSCITHARFLVLVHHAYATGAVATIKDRVRGAVVGEVTARRTPSTLAGAAAGNGRYLMSTVTPLGRDASAIERCWDSFSPIAPDF